MMKLLKAFFGHTVSRLDRVEDGLEDAVAGITYDIDSILTEMTKLKADFRSYRERTDKLLRRMEETDKLLMENQRKREIYLANAGRP